jgi:hypothetical protein
LGGESETDQIFCGEYATPPGTSIDAAWAPSGVDIAGASEGTLQRASQPSIIMHPDSAMPTGPSRTHNTRTTSVAKREPLMASSISRKGPWESSSGAVEIAGQFSP